MLNVPFGQIGQVSGEKILLIKDEDGKNVIHIELDRLKKAWKQTFDW
jgi:hypothetical protein